MLQAQTKRFRLIALYLSRLSMHDTVRKVGCKHVDCKFDQTRDSVPIVSMQADFDSRFLKTCPSVPSVICLFSTAFDANG